MILTENDLVDTKGMVKEFENSLILDDIINLISDIYRKDEKYYLYLSPQPLSNSIIKSSFCLCSSSIEELEKNIEELICNIGIILVNDNRTLKADGSKTIFVNESVKNRNRIVDNEEILLTDLESLSIEVNGIQAPILKGEELTKVLRNMQPVFFENNQNINISAFILKTIYGRINGIINLNEEDLDLIKYYKSVGYVTINSFLDSNALIDDFSFENFVINKEFIDKLYQLYDLFDKLPVTKENLVVYRGETHREQTTNIVRNQFVSTSLDKKQAEIHSEKVYINKQVEGQVYRIKLPKGTKYIPVDLINNLNDIPEGEILLRPSVLKKICNENNLESNIINVQAEEIDNYPMLIIQSLERMKNEYIKKTSISEEEYNQIIEYARIKALYKEKDKLNNEDMMQPPFEFVSSINLGGTGEMYEAIDNLGREYLFKPAISKFDKKVEPFRAEVQEIAYKIQKIVNPEGAVKCSTITINNQFGTIQEKIKTNKNGFDLLKWQIEDGEIPQNILDGVMREYVTDYLLCNFDSHSRNFILGDDGIVRGIDKEQSFKYLQDKESQKPNLEYNPNAKYNELEPIYNTIFRRYIQGSLDLNLGIITESMNRVDQISDKEYREMFKPYVDSIEFENKSGLLDLIVKRKSEMHNNINHFINSIKAKREMIEKPKDFTNNLTKEQLLQIKEQAIQYDEIYRQQLQDNPTEFSSHHSRM